mmetsp:Transcript_37192/g.57125  ORF Transcript_37192/g.57125 Transcript_37192/m.57125 type:complete len:357 (+) Transcript_37192:117-1187(+)
MFRHLIVSIFLWTSSNAFVPSTSRITRRSNIIINTRIYSQEPPSSPGEYSKQQAVLDEASDALKSVGWAQPLEGDEEMTSDDPFVKTIDASIQNDFGVSLDDLLNPAKVVNLERDLFNLRAELASLTGKDSLENNNSKMTRDEYDGGGGGQDADAIRKTIDKKEKDLNIERRAVFRGWLKNVFLGQAVVSFVLSWFMATDPTVLLIGDGAKTFFLQNRLDMPVRVLGFWWWWLFIVPSLRSRRPGATEKKALDVAFLGTPLVSLVAPVATKDTTIIWFANFAIVLAAYAYAYLLTGDNDNVNTATTATEQQQPQWLKFIYKSLDFGSGKERGLRSWQREEMFEKEREQNEQVDEQQ